MQKKGWLAKAVLAGTVTLTLASPVLADSFTNGYTRRDGTYVQPHYRSTPDGNFQNNWSTRGNVNPYTGQQGTRDYPSQSLPSVRSYSFPSSPGWSSPNYRSRW